MVDVVVAEAVLCVAGVVDPGIVHHKGDFAVPDFRVVVRKRSEEINKDGGFERAVFDLVVDDALGGNAHEERDVDSSVRRDGNGRRSSFWCPAPERGQVEVEPLSSRNQSSWSGSWLTRWA